MFIYLITCHLINAVLFTIFMELSLVLNILWRILIKNTMKYILLFLLLSSTLYAQPGWHWQNPLPTGHDMRDIEVVNTSLSFAIGPFGNILRTTNNGGGWSIVYSGTEAMYLNEINFLDTQLGFAVGRLGTILKSSNGGLNWAPLISGITNELRTVEFVNSLTGIAAGSGGTIIRTTNSGVNWVATSSGVTTTLEASHFPTSGVGYLTGANGVILKSTDAGANWVWQSSTTTTNFMSIYFTDVQVGYTVGENSGSIYKTTNGGTNWFAQNAGIFFDQHEVKFLNANTGIITGADPHVILRTTDAGNVWSIVSNGTPYFIQSFAMVDFNFGIAAGVSIGTPSLPKLYKTSNSGVNWNELQYKFGIQKNLKSVDFINMNTGIAVGDSGTILKTTNGGMSWNSIPSGNTHNLKEVQMINANTGFVVGRNSTLLKTTDGGSSWNLIATPISHLYDVFFQNPNTGTVTGTGIWRTTNGGANWLMQDPDNDTIQPDIYYRDDEYGIKAGGVVYTTTNAGTNWINQTIQGDYYSVSYADANTGIMVGNHVLSGSNRIRRTTNGTFVDGTPEIVLPTDKIIYGSDFVAPSTFVLTGQGGVILKSTDRGLTWSQPTALTEYDLYDIEYVADSIGYVIGNNGTILSTIPGGTVGVVQGSTIVPQDFTLMQNYPNPFNPTTVINYQLPKNSFVSFKVYDITGKLISELVNQNQSAGEYAVTFDGSILPSGVYFYKLETETFSETKKMALIK